MPPEPETFLVLDGKTRYSFPDKPKAVDPVTIDLDEVFNKFNESVANFEAITKRLNEPLQVIQEDVCKVLSEHPELLSSNRFEMTNFVNKVNKIAFDRMYPSGK